jgi:hypothetical protein
MAHYSGYFAPSPGAANLAGVAQALRDSGYDPGEAEAELRLTVRALPGDADEFLRLDQEGGVWDPAFARALSAELDGFVAAVNYESVPDRYAEALFFCGRTIHARSWNVSQSDLDYGPPRLPEELLGVHVLDTYKQYFAGLCHHDKELLADGQIVTSAAWGMSPHPLEFGADGEVAFSMIVLANFAEGFEAVAATNSAMPGWRRRVRHTRNLGWPYVELRGEWPLARDAVAELSGRLQCQALGLEVSGAGREFCWAEAHHGAMDAEGRGNSPAEFIRVLDSLSWLIAEMPGMLFGLGAGGWLE